ncbi:MAG: 23S rRNA (adenine(2503)-C(2))-methyltransferase RlmN [Ruminococcaceae bacterium]|nr:23S rRNA (adenine(2503)-C(2))-methyltransferase RlmN [Oscillospiraceae bacterium]
MEKINLKDLTISELEGFLEKIGEKKFRAKQIFKWLSLGVVSFDEMTDISKDLRKKLSDISFISKMEIERKLVSKIDKTTKYLFKLSDGNMVEAVVMYYKHGITICISSQVGCRMGCKFCASTIGGLVRNLSAGEILDEVIFAQKDIGERISNIVMMGIGEPLDNFDNVIKFLENVNNPLGLNIGYRHISLSTCGIVKNIVELEKLNIPITLSISLHAPTDDLRGEIMPVNNAYNVDTLIDACKRYVEKTNRRISFEYTMIKGVNDSENIARILAKKLKGMLCHVNLIPVNEVDETHFKKSDTKQIEKFIAVLEKSGITTTVRRKLGSDINASCGQLRRSNMK